MYKLLIKAPDGGILLTGAGSDEHSLREYGENWINENEVYRNMVIVEITGFHEHGQASIPGQQKHDGD